MAVTIVQLLGSAFLLVLAIMLTVFACTLIPEPRNPLIVMALVYYMFSPVPYALCGIDNSGGGGGAFLSTGQQSPLLPISHFLSGMFFTAGPCTALVLYHTGNVSQGAMWLSFGSGALLVAAVLVMLKPTRSSSEDEDF